MTDRVYDRQSARLYGYDYTLPGAYFITICTFRRKLLFGLETLARIVVKHWYDLPAHHAHLSLDEFVVMPNHIHGVLVLEDKEAAVGAQPAAPTSGDLDSPLFAVVAGSLGAIVRSFKASVTKELHALHVIANRPVWQRNYYDHIIRDEESLERIRYYIRTNPERWDFDRENPVGSPDKFEAEFWAWVEDQDPRTARAQRAAPLQADAVGG